MKYPIFQLNNEQELEVKKFNQNEKIYFFIDEIHRLNRVVEEALYPAIEDFVFDIMT